MTKVKFRSRNCPQHFGTSPLIRGKTDMVGLLLGSRELLCLFGRISGTFLLYNSLSELCLPGESASCQMQGKSVGCWSMITFLLARRGVFQGVTSTSRQPGARHIPSLPPTGTGARHVTSLPPTRARVQCPLCGNPSASFTFADLIRCSSS